jgi:hypothetical protein
MERYISIENAIKIVAKALPASDTYLALDVATALEDAPDADVVPREEADKYFAECKHLQQMLDAAIAGQETLQQYFLIKDSPDGIMLRYNEKTGKWDKYEPYMTIECPEEKDYAFIETAIAKQIFKKPLKESLADYGCPTCGAYINFDGLNGNVEHAPKYCSECGQRLDWMPLPEPPKK